MTDYKEIKRLRSKVADMSQQYIEERLKEHGPYVMPDSIFPAFRDDFYDVNIVTRQGCVWATLSGIHSTSGGGHPTFIVSGESDTTDGSDSYSMQPCYSDAGTLLALTHFINWWEEHKMDEALENLKQIVRSWNESEDDDERDRLMDQADEWFEYLECDPNFEVYMEGMTDILVE